MARSISGVFVLLVLWAAPAPTQTDVENRIQELRATQERLMQELAEVQRELAHLEEQAREARIRASGALLSAVLANKARMFQESDFSGATSIWVAAGELVDVFDVDGAMVRIAHREQTGWIRITAFSQSDQSALKGVSAMRRRSRGSEPFLVTGLKVKGPDSAGGVGVVVRFMMLDDERTLKYMTVTYTPYNGVGDRVASELSGRVSTTKAKITGPITFQDGEEVMGGDPIWYNPSIRCVRIDRIDVEYMSGERYTYIQELPKVVDPSIRNNCAIQVTRP
jgi:hypothetical protein